MEKPTICIGENKGAFVFATRIVQFLLYLTPKFQASTSFWCLYRPVCVGPVRKPHCWFSHEAAQGVDNVLSCNWLRFDVLLIKVSVTLFNYSWF